MNRINPHWLKSLAIHAVTLMVATFIVLVAGGNKEAELLLLMLFMSFWFALISPLAYPIVSPYMVSFLLAIHIAGAVQCSWNLLFGVIAILSYAMYFALLLGAILAKSKCFRVGCCILLSAWFDLTLYGVIEWLMCWSV